MQTLCYCSFYLCNIPKYNELYISNSNIADGFIISGWLGSIMMEKLAKLNTLRNYFITIKICNYLSLIIIVGGIYIIY